MLHDFLLTNKHQELYMFALILLLISAGPLTASSTPAQQSPSHALPTNAISEQLQQAYIKAVNCYFDSITNHGTENDVACEKLKEDALGAIRKFRDYRCHTFGSQFGMSDAALLAKFHAIYCTAQEKRLNIRVRRSRTESLTLPY